MGKEVALCQAGLGQEIWGKCGSTLVFTKALSFAPISVFPFCALSRFSSATEEMHRNALGALRTGHSQVGVGLLRPKDLCAGQSWWTLVATKKLSCAPTSTIDIG